MDYTRKCIRYLCSQSCFGRGYLKGGLERSAEFIRKDLKSAGALPLFSTGYYQWFSFNVNTFPDKISLKLNHKALQAGRDFIPSPDACSVKGRYVLKRHDSTHFESGSETNQVRLEIKNKLTFGVSSNSVASCGIQVLNSCIQGEPEELELNIHSKVLTKYTCKNICAYVPGTVNNDSLIVFTAHYDHLGGLGKTVFFPGANDNASGVSMLLNLVKHYAAYPPKYRTVFVFFAGEEAGLLGSKYFVEQNTLNPGYIKFLINLDLLGTGEEGIMVVNGAVHEKEFQRLETINTQNHYLPAVKKRGKAKNSDHYWFSEAGVPCFFIYTMGGIKAYHDIYDMEKTLPLSKYSQVYNLILDFVRYF